MTASDLSYPDENAIASETEPEHGNENSNNATDGSSDDDEEHASQKRTYGMPEGPPAPIYVIVNDFHELTADGANFGVITHGVTGDAPETGRIDAAIVSTTVERYADPAPYVDARKALKEDNVVVLAGARGCGKRTGAIALLRDVLTAGSPIISLSPTATLKELAKQLAKNKSSSPGQGYCMFERQLTERGREASHQWEVIGGIARETGKYVVITTREHDRRLHEGVRRIRWERPEAAKALRVHMGDTVTDEVIADVVTSLPPDYAMADLVAVAGRVMDLGVAPCKAVATVFDQSERRAVEEWFDQDPSLPQVLDITTLAFASRIGVREFEERQSRLQALLAELQQQSRARVQTADQDADAETATTLVLQRRTERLFKHDLIHLERAVTGGVSRKMLVFREDGYRRHTLEKLADEYGNELWDAVREWLHETVLEDAWRLRIASGLALLAHASFDEVENSYLTPWSSGNAGWKGRYAAASTLWFMCREEELRPTALRTAVRWASYGSTPARLTAIVAFVGQLGVHYPTEAARRLWQLVEQPGEPSPVAAAAFGDLFASLVSKKSGERQIINHLSRQVSVRNSSGNTGRLHRLSLRAALAVVRARNPATGYPAIIEYVCTHPEEIPVVTRMWAALLRHRPIRHEALTALHAGLHALDKLTSSASDYARRLGISLGEALPDTEHEGLVRDLAKRTRHRKYADSSAALAQVLIKALERTRRKRKE